MNRWAYQLSNTNNIRSDPSLVDRKVLVSVMLEWLHSLCSRVCNVYVLYVKMLYDYH